MLYNIYSNLPIKKKVRERSPISLVKNSLIEFLKASRGPGRFSTRRTDPSSVLEFLLASESLILECQRQNFD